MSVRKRKWTTAGGEAKEAWVANYVDNSGIRRLKTFERKKEALDFAATTAVEIREGVHVAEAATASLAEAGEKWIATCQAAGLERSTLDQYRAHLKFHLNPYLGQVLLSKLTVATIRAFQDRLQLEGRSPTMVKRVTISLGSILADALERGIVGRNVVREMAKARPKGRVRRGERRQKKRLQVGTDIPARGEVAAIVRHLEGRYRPLILTAIFSGLRSSELRGLRWSDVDLTKGDLHVRQRADRYQEIGMPKSDAGQRSVPLPPLVINTLRVWRLTCPKFLVSRDEATNTEKRELRYVFPNGAGNIESHGNIINRGLLPVQVTAGVSVDGGRKTDEGEPIMEAKYTGLHALRHFYASWLINRRVDGGLELPAKVVQARLGHSSITMTLDVYGHLFPNNDDQTALADAELSLLAAR